MNQSASSNLKRRFLLIGWDAADWKVIEPLLAAGEMPHLASLIAGGVRANVATIYPPLSPMVWTSIATGKRADKHGIHGFSEPLPDGSGVRPISILSRRTKAVWNILNQNGWRSLVVGWWPSHPAEPLDGVMVSNHFQRAVGEPGRAAKLPPGTVHPASLAPALAELRVNPMELEGEFIRLFVPGYQKVDQAKDKRLHSLGRIVAETMSVHAVATELLATQAWDFAAIYYDAIDHFGHGFMGYHPPRLPWVSEADFAIYQGVMANAYRYHDAMLGGVLRFADEQTTVLLLSDHGFHPDHLRPGYIPAEAAGPAVEHRHFGILCLKGPAVRANERLYGASVLDICPTVLALCGLPPGLDMDGKVLVTAFREPPRLEPIPSWDNVPGAAGLHPPETRLDAVASAQAFKQLVELGYVAPPGPDAREQVAETECELKYNLARACRDGGRGQEAAALLRDLWKRWPKEHRFGLELIECLEVLDARAERGQVIAELERRMELYRAEAEAELARRAEKPKPAAKAETPAGLDGPTREQFEERKLRELAQPQTLVLEWLKASQALLERRHTEARQRLDKLLAAPQLGLGLAQRAAVALAQLGDRAAAKNLLERMLLADADNPAVHAQLARLHFQARRWDEAASAAAESLGLLYFQPALHALLGKALLETGRLHEAETELKVALAQQPRLVPAHAALGKLYREHLDRPAEAFVHEGKAMSLRNELRQQRRAAAAARAGAPVVSALAPESVPQPARVWPPPDETPSLPPPFGPEVQGNITVVSGLPRSGTSMMMQLLAAGGLPLLTDGQRAADADNPLGYLEFEPARELAKNRAWLPQARGKGVKVVAQLLPHLPADEHYQVIFMRRDLREIVASQRAMLARQQRAGAACTDAELMAVFDAQLRRIEAHLAGRPEVRLLQVDYARLLADPAAGVAQVAAFLGGTFHTAAAVAAVRPDLRRQNT